MKEDALFLYHIYERTSRILDTTAKITRDEFFENYMYQDTIIRSLEVIGEAANKLSEEFCESHPEIFIKEMIGLRNVLIHKYSVVDLKLVWKIVMNDIPQLHEHVSAEPISTFTSIYISLALFLSVNFASLNAYFR